MSLPVMYICTNKYTGSIRLCVVEKKDESEIFRSRSLAPMLSSLYYFNKTVKNVCSQIILDGDNTQNYLNKILKIDPYLLFLMRFPQAKQNSGRIVR